MNYLKSIKKFETYAEITAYGMMGLFSAVLLFFGSLYPELTLVEEAYRITNAGELSDVELSDMELSDVELSDVELSDVELKDIELDEEDLKTLVCHWDKSGIKVKCRLYTYVRDSLE